MGEDNEKLEKELEEVGNALLSPPSSVEQLIPLLERIESCLSRVKQSQYASMRRALKPSMESLVQKALLDNTDADVRVYVASCLIEVAKITAPSIPYDDVKMEGICRLIVSTFGNMADISHPLFHKRVSILEWFAKLKLFLVMVNPKCYDLIVDMFKHFLHNIREYHSDDVYSFMGFSMIIVLEENDKVPLELLSTLLESVRKENKEVSPKAWKLAKRVIDNCSSKIGPNMFEAVKHKGFPLEGYSKLVTFVCHDVFSFVPDGLESNEFLQEVDTMGLEGSELDFDEFSPEDAASEKYDICGANYLGDENYSVNPNASKTVPQRNTPVCSATERKGNSPSKDVGVHLPSGLGPLDDKIGEDYNIETGFSVWFEKGLKKKKKKWTFMGEDDIISPPLDLGVVTVQSKTWFLNLKYAGHLFDSDHIDAIFYYLRLKGKYSSDSICVKFTTTDNLFDQSIQTLYSTFMKSKCDLSIVTSDHIVATHIMGRGMLRNTEWSCVDHVLFPIHISGGVLSSKGGHWVLGRLSTNEKCIFVYNSLRSGRNDKSVVKVVEAYAVLLPHFFKLLGFYQKRNDVNFAGSPYVGKDASDSLKIKMVDDLPTQADNDCGLFVVSFAEYFIRGKDIPVSKFDVVLHRSRLANLLWSYARGKQIGHVESDEVR